MATVKAVAKVFTDEYGADTWARREIQPDRFTDCGVSMGVQLAEPLRYLYPHPPNSPEWRTYAEGKWVNCDDLYRIPITHPISAISCSSIVEGVDECCDGHVIDLSEYRTGKQVYKAFMAALDST